MQAINCEKKAEKLAAVAHINLSKSSEDVHFTLLFCRG